MDNDGSSRASSSTSEAERRCGGDSSSNTRALDSEIYLPFRHQLERKVVCINFIFSPAIPQLLPSADMQEELARCSQRQLQETEVKLRGVERSAAEAAKEQARVLAEREEAWSAKLREAQHEARAVSERHQTELDKQAAALRALEQQLAAEKETAVADKAALALSREQAVVERESREQLEATLRAKSQALEEATNTIAELRHQLAAATETNAELRHQLAAATETNAELRHQLAAATDTNAELAADGEAVGGQRMDEVASARVAMKYGGVVDITVRSQPCGGTLVMRHFEMSNSTKHDDEDVEDDVEWPWDGR
eukprot:jgi/Chrpa1/10604/Chrysochromulina_OHIO_Genome00020810-RA